MYLKNWCSEEPMGDRQLDRLRRKLRQKLCILVDSAEATCELMVAQVPPLTEQHRAKLLARRKEEREAYADYSSAKLNLLNCLLAPRNRARRSRTSRAA
jgi:hypothetical protein